MSKDNSFGGYDAFDSLVGTLVGPGGSKDNTWGDMLPPADGTDGNDDNQDDTDDSIDGNQNNKDQLQQKDIDGDDSNNQDDNNDNNTDDNKTDNQDDVNNDNDKNGNQDGDSNDPEDLTKFKGEITEYFKSELSKELGWDLGEEIKTPEDIIEYMEELVTDNSAPDYPSEEVKKLADFVSNGGDLKSYYDKVYGQGLNVDDISIEDSISQKNVIRSLLKYQGYSDKRIESRLEKFEDTGILEEEAQDALGMLKNIQKEQSEKLLEQQKKINEQQQKQQQELYNTVVSSIDNKKDVFGIPLSKNRKEELKRAIFDVETDGTTRYQKAHSKNMVDNVIISAYLALYPEEFSTKIKNKASSDAALQLRNKLSGGSKRLKGTGDVSADGENSQRDNFDSLVKRLTGKNK